MSAVDGTLAPRKREWFFTLMLGLSLSALSTDLRALQSTPTHELFTREVASLEKLQPPSESLGESVNAQTGGISFTQTDIKLEGNGPPIAVTRSFDAQSAYGLYAYSHYKKFADWKLEIPRIHTIDYEAPSFVAQPVYIPNGNWDVYLAGAATSTARCSQYPTSFTIWGMQLDVPGMGSQEILSRSAENAIAPSMSINGVSLPFPLVTNKGWAFSCIANGVKNGKPGDAFLAVAPDGTKYWFDWMTFDYIGIWSGLAPYPSHMLDASLLVTKVEDRFGNQVLYTYEADRLVRVTANDGRDMKIIWTSDKKISPDNVPRYYISQIIVQPDSATPQIWNYGYTSNNSHWSLTTVTLPDASKWLFDIGPLKYPTLPISPESTYQPTYQLLQPATVTTPSGLVATYTQRTGPVGRSGTALLIVGDVTNFSAAKLAVKRYSGPGVDLTWNYSYITQFPFDVPVLEAQMRVKNPDGTLQVTAVDNLAGTGSGPTPRNPTEGLLLRTEYFAPDEVTLLRREEYEYAQNLGPYPQKFGASQSAVGRSRKESIWPLRKRTITQDGATFTRTVNSYDVFGRPVSVTSSSEITP